MEQKTNYLLLAASLLTVGILIEFGSRWMLASTVNVVYKTLFVMFMVAIGYGFAAGILTPFAARSLKILQGPFVKLAGSVFGRILFYGLIYGILFVLYLLVFIYGMNLSNLSIAKIAT